jgi:hypothetical protein
MYGQQYQGTIEPIVAAGLMRLLGTDLFVIRLGSVLLFGIFLAVHGALAYRLWGARVALLSLVFLALPGRFILHWTYRPITNFGPMAICGTGMLLAALPSVGGWRHYARLAGIGCLAGVGLWSQPLTAIYIAVLGLVWFLGTPEWRDLYARLAQFCARVVQISARELLPVVAIGVFGLAVLVLFTNACEPAISYGRPRQVARLVLLGGAAGVALAAAITSRRRPALLGGAAGVAGGFALGNAPQWGAWLFDGIAPSPTIFPACPTDSFVRLRIGVREIYLLVWGLPSWPEMKDMTLGPRLPWLAALAIVIAALAAFGWANRRTHWSLLGLAPLAREHQPQAAVALLLAIPMTMILFGGNTFDWTAIRYLLIAWQAGAIVLALFLAWLAARSRGIAAAVLVFWVGLVGLGNLSAADRAWAGIGPVYAPAPVATLQRFLEAHDTHGAYADYWTVNTLSLVSQEQLLLAPYNGVDRYPDYTRRVDALPLRAFLVRPGLIPPDRASAGDLAQTLFDRDKMGGTGPAFARFGELLRHAVVLERSTVAGWDVWIVKQ